MSSPPSPPSPSLPMLTQTFSDGSSYCERDTMVSKLGIVVAALVDSVIPATHTLPYVKLRIVEFNSNARFLASTDAVAGLYPTGGTHFKNAFACLKETPVPDGTRSVTVLLTDGYDSIKENRAELLASNQYCDFFDGVIGVGNDVDIAFLKHLSSKTPNTFTHACDPNTLQNAIKACCFGGATAVATNVSFVFWLENRGIYIPTDSSITTETVEMMDAVDPSVPRSDLFTCNYSPVNDIFALSVKEQSVVDETPTPTIVTFCIDTSYSMSESVTHTTKRPVYASSTNKSGGYLKVNVDLRMVDNVYKFIGKGPLQRVDVTYTNRRGEMCSETVMEIMEMEADPYSPATYELGAEMLGIMRALESSATNIKQLYLTKLTCLGALQDPSIPAFMKQLFTFVWERLRNAYKMTLNPSYEAFLERGCDPDTQSPCMTQLVHTLSAAASDHSARAVTSPLEKRSTKCSICFDAETTILCLPCKQIGSCKTCFERVFGDFQKKNPAASYPCPPCPFCKTPVEEVREIVSIKCPCCDSPATRVGVCRHPLACGNATCRVGDPSADTLYCHTCKEHVGSFHVWHQ